VPLAGSLLRTCGEGLRSLCSRVSGASPGYSSAVTDHPGDRPTEPLRPRMPIEREVVSVPAADPGVVAYVADQVRSLKTAVTLLAMVALAALGLALYLLLTDDARDQHGASRARVARLEDRVKRLEADAAKASEESDVTRLQARLQGKASKTDVQQLSDNVTKLRTAVAQAGPQTMARDISRLSGRVDKLETDVSQLRSKP